MKWEKVNATLPKGTEPETVTMDMALDLIAEKEAKGGKKKPSRGQAKKRSAGE